MRKYALIGRRKTLKEIGLDRITVMQSDAHMPQRGESQAESDAKKAVRITVSLPPESYETVLRMAKNKKVSAAWVVRDAVDKYLAADQPLFYTQQK